MYLLLTHSMSTSWDEENELDATWVSSGSHRPVHHWSNGLHWATPNDDSHLLASESGLYLEI